MDMVVIAVSLLMNLAFTLHYCGYVYLSDKYAEYLYSKGLLTRCKATIMTAGTDIYLTIPSIYQVHNCLLIVMFMLNIDRKSMKMQVENFCVAFSTFYPPVWYMVGTVLPVIDTLEFTFRPIQTWIALCGIYICFDTWYFFGHKFIHETPWLYKTIHKRHHDMVPIDSYVAGRAEIMENILLTMPGMFIWTYLYLNIVDAPNAWAILIPVTSQLHDFILVHIGYYDSLILYVINPFSLIMQYSLGARYTAARHEQHHNLFIKNYGPMLPWLDRIFGTAKEVDSNYWKISFESERKAAGEKRKEAEETNAERPKLMTFQARA